MITLLVPLAQNRVRYSAASGRRFHVIDQLLLGAIKSGEATTVGAMQLIFRLPRRMIVEVLVTLLEDNAIQLQGDSADAFELTVAAREALASGQQRPRTGFHLEEKSTIVVMERLTGGLIHRNDVRLSSKSELRNSGIWHKAWPLPSECETDVADEGEVSPFIRPGRDRWLYRILDVEMAGDGSYWLPVDVDLDSGDIIGLPHRWLARLRPALLDFASRAPRELFSSWRFWKESTAPISEQPEGWLVQSKENDLLFSARDHLDLLCATLAATTAHSSIFVSSPLYDPGWLVPSVRSAFKDALLRGVHIDLLWGTMASGVSQGGTPLDGLRKLEEEAKGLAAAGSIRFNSRPHSCRTSVLINSADEGAWACVTSYPWLGGQSDGEFCGLRVSHPGAVAEICWSAAALLLDAGQKLLASPYGWRTIAGRLQRDADELPQSGDARLTVSRGYSGMIEELAADGGHLLIATGQLSEQRLTLLLDGLARSSVKASITSGKTPPESAALVREAKGTGGEFAVGSQSCAIFSSPVFGDTPAGRPTQISIKINGGPIPGLLREHFGVD